MIHFVRGHRRCFYHHCAMGQGLKKHDGSHEHGLSERERKLVRDIWDAFCTEHRDYGVIIFSALFLTHPELQKLFPGFRDKPVRNLKGDVKFRYVQPLRPSYLRSNITDPSSVLLIKNRRGIDFLQ